MGVADFAPVVADEDLSFSPTATLHEADHPRAGAPRRFSALAMPKGDRRFGVEGQLVLLTEDRGAALPRLKLLSRGEAVRLRAALDRALRAFDVGEAFDAERATAYTGPFPDHSAPTMAELRRAGDAAR